MKDLSNQHVIHITQDGIQYIQFRKLLEYQHEVKHAYSLGTDINFRTRRVDKTPLTKQEYDKAIDSYINLCESIDTDYTHVVRPNQEHTDCVRIVRQKIHKHEPDFNVSEYNETDGLITNQKDILLATTNADCILLLFYDPIQKVIANVHSGWKGTVQRIAEKTVEKMIKEYHCQPQDIICCICPSIRKCHFEVDEDVKVIFEKEFEEILTENIKSEIIEETIAHKKWNIDTVKINEIILEKQGLKPENIVDSGICSVCHSDMIHSYRVEKQGYGLGAALIEMSK